MTASFTWLGHATIRLELPDERVILIDPWLTDNPSCHDFLKNPSRCDMILLTHGHADHVGDVEKLVREFNPAVVGNFELCNIFAARTGSDRCSGMNPGGTQTVDGVRITLTQAFHSSSVDSDAGPIYAGMPNGVIVSPPGLASVYHAGDTDVFGDMKLIAQLFQPKVCVLPIGDHFTMGAKGAALAAEFLQPNVIVPVHYKTFPLLAQSADEFHRALPSELQERLVVPDVGEELTWTATGLQTP